MALTGMDRLKEAEAEAWRAFDSAARRGPRYARFAFLLQLRLGHIMNARGEHERALLLSEQAAAGCRGDETSRSDTGTVAVVAAGALLGLGRTGEAVERARSALEDCRAGLSPVHHRALSAESLLGEVDHRIS